MNILITGAGFENKGAEAMLLTTQHELNQRIPDVCFYATVYEREQRHALEAGFIPLLNECGTLRSLNYLYRLAQISRRLPVEVCITINQMIFALLPVVGSKILVKNNIDALVDVSGFSFHDGGVYRMLNALCGIRSSLKVSRKNFFLPQAWGGFTNTVSKYWIRRLHSQATMLFSRDTISSKYLLEAGVDTKTIREAPDIAFLFKECDLAVGQSILAQNGIFDFHRPLIGIVPNMRVYERTSGRGTGNEYLKMLEVFVSHCVGRLKTNVVLLPNECILPGSNNPDDRYLCSLLRTRISCRDHVAFMTDNYRASELKSVIGNCQLVIASRFHSLVFALSQGVPAIAFGWSHKYSELLKLFSMEEYVIGHEAINMHRGLALLETAWACRRDIANNINQSLPDVRKSASEVFDSLLDSCRN